MCGGGLGWVRGGACLYGALVYITICSGAVKGI